jgi:hypothetical protein
LDAKGANGCVEEVAAMRGDLVVETGNIEASVGARAASICLAASP